MVPVGLVPVVVLLGLPLLAAGAVVPVPVVVAEATPLPLPLPGVPELLAGVAAGVEAGRDVNGVGSGGNGFARMPATSWSMPVIALLFRYLYQVVRLSFQAAFP